MTDGDSQEGSSKKRKVSHRSMVVRCAFIIDRHSARLRRLIRLPKKQSLHPRPKRVRRWSRRKRTTKKKRSNQMFPPICAQQDLTRHRRFHTVLTVRLWVHQVQAFLFFLLHRDVYPLQTCLVACVAVFYPSVLVFTNNNIHFDDNF